MDATTGGEPPETSIAVRSVRGLLIAVLLASFAYLIVKSIDWPLLADASSARYVNFLADHGFAPYRDVADLNLPGSYFSDRVAVFLFGPSDVGWRMYDISLMVSTTLGMIAIAWPVDWFAGLFAGILFSLLHAADGPSAVGERDLVIAALLIAGYVFLFYSVRKARPVAMALFGLALGMAATVKPTTAPLGFLLLSMAAVVLHRQRARWLPYALYGLLGAGAAAAIFFGFLLRHHALAALIEITHNVTVYYSGLGRASAMTLVREIVPRAMRPLVPIGVALAVMNRRQWNWERWALILGVAMGMFSYFAQGKGFNHHRYELMAFSLLWFFIEVAIAARRSGAARIVAVAGVVIGTVWVIPKCLVQIKEAAYAGLFRFTSDAVTDLRVLNVDDRLQGKVQCLDMTDGCLNALYRVRLVQNSGTIGDTLLFSLNNGSPVVQQYRQVFWEHLQSDPPDVFLMSNELFLDPPSFEKPNRWPLFAQYLAEHYDLYCERRMDDKFAYRIYVRKDTFANQPGCAAE